jgi:hypothetical protein
MAESLYLLQCINGIHSPIHPSVHINTSLPRKIVLALFWCISFSILVQIIARRPQTRTILRARLSAEPTTLCGADTWFQQPRQSSWEMLLRTTLQTILADKKGERVSLLCNKARGFNIICSGNNTQDHLLQHYLSG